MTTNFVLGWLTLILQVGGLAPPYVAAAAQKFVPGVYWQPDSVLVSDFSCHGTQEPAILGTNKSWIVLAVFVHGTKAKPELLRFSAGPRDTTTTTLTSEDLDYDPLTVLGMPLQGFVPSTTCKGLNLSDGKIDSAHIYWNRKARRFNDWVL